MPSTFRELDWYETPHYYDIIFDVDTGREADFLEAAQQRYGRSRGRRVLEPAAGSGRLLVELARRGWRCTGFDASQPMLDYAGERLSEQGLSARLVQARMEDFELRGPFDLAHCLVSTFKYLLDEDSARAHLERVAAALAPGGIYVLGLHLSEYGLGAISHERWVAERDDTRVVCNIRGWPPERRRRRERVRSRLAVEQGGERRFTETEWWFRTYDARQLSALVESVPALELVAVHDFDYRLESSGPIDDERLDRLLILRRPGGRGA